MMTAALPWESGAQAGVPVPLAGEPSLSVLICKWDHLPPGTPSSILEVNRKAPGRLRQSQDACP